MRGWVVLVVLVGLRTAGAKWCEAGQAVRVPLLGGSQIHWCCPVGCADTCGTEFCQGYCCVGMRQHLCRSPTSIACTFFTGVGEWSTARRIEELSPARDKLEFVKKAFERADVARTEGQKRGAVRVRRELYDVYSEPRPSEPLQCRALRPRHPIRAVRDPPHPQVSFKGSPSGCAFPQGARGYGQGREDIAIYHRYFCMTCGGVFVELGAVDGETVSNTLFFEESLNWTGVLIEANPGPARKLMASKRRGRSKKFAPMAVCNAHYASVHKYLLVKDSARLGQSSVGPLSLAVQNKSEWGPAVRTPCQPIGSLIRQAGHTHVDLFSLDVEGAELEVLKTMDWTIPVRVFLIEMNPSTPKRNVLLRLYLLEKGYRKAKWDLSAFCCPECWCMFNEVFENVELVADLDNP
eukprot:Hpha_TRINITY_DN22247_c0_g1::TRINITY_DN22247_c0_g1_i1::g.167070::m.167070